MDNKHTPTTWVTPLINYEVVEDGRGGYLSLSKARAKTGIDICPIAGLGRTREEAETNLKLAVRAVNSHAALVEACKALIKSDDDICHDRGLKSDQAMNRIAALDMAEQALALAEGGGE